MEKVLNMAFIELWDKQMLEFIVRQIKWYDDDSKEILFQNYTGEFIPDLATAVQKLLDQEFAKELICTPKSEWNKIIEDISSEPVSIESYILNNGVFQKEF